MMMNKVPPTPIPSPSLAGHSVKTKLPGPTYIRFFFVAMACLFCILALLGFVPSYQAMKDGSYSVHWVVHIHGALMSGWLLIFLSQSILAAKGNLNFHRQLGIISVGLGVLVWFSMGIVSFRVLIGFPPQIENIPLNVLLVQMSGMNLFGLFFIWGILVRKKDISAHKRLLLLATLVLLQAAIGRIQWLPLTGIENPLVFFLYADALLIPLFIYDLLTIRRIHQITWIGSVCMIIIQLIVKIL